MIGPTAVNVNEPASGVIGPTGLLRCLQEDTDRTAGLGLPGVQPKLLAALRNATAARHAPLVALLVSGSPLATPDLLPPSADAVDALLWTSYFGQASVAALMGWTRTALLPPPLSTPVHGP